MNNPNTPYGFPDNVHLLNNMSMLLGAASNQQHDKPLLQYQYTNVNAVHPMNLATTTSAGPSVVQATTTIDPVALVYQQNHEAILLQQHQQQQQQQQFQQQHHQQQQAQPISYKIPQLNTAAVASVVNQIQTQNQQSTQQHQQTTSSSSAHNLIQKKKDIVAEAIRAADSATEIKKEPVSSSSASTSGTTGGGNSASTNSTSTNSTNAPAVAIKSEPSTSGSSSTAASNANKPASNSTTTTNRPGPKPGSTRGRGSSNYGRGGHARTQIMPRLQLLDDEDDGVTCRMCLQPFWYKSQLHEHLKTTHSITDPERYEKEEREKKLRRLREEQHRMALAQRGRGGVMMRGRGGTMIRGRGGVMISRGGLKRPLHTGPRPSFQYRDGSFICDLCKKSFSDGNDMVTHWKSHVKQQRANMAAAGGSLGRGRGRPGMPPGRGRGRGRGAPGRPGRGAGRPPGRGIKKEKKEGRSDKGKPRWTAYLLWSTRRRKELTAENESYTFAQIGRIISDEWKKVEGDDLDKLKEEAEKLNFEGVKKLPKKEQSGSSSNSEEWSEDEDPSFDETNVKKPIMLKIKREKEERNTRQRKRPSFFQDYENEENNLDKILDEFEQEQILEARAPREPKPKREPKAAGSTRPRKRRAPSPTMMDEEKEIELETSRSGRVRKIRRRKVYAFDDPDEPDEDSGDDGDEFQPESEPEEPDEEYIEEARSDSNDEGGEGGPTLPFKKRKGEAMTKEEIEAAKRAAFAAKPQIVMDSKKFKGKDRRDEIDRIITPGEEDNLDLSDDELSQVLKMQVKKEPAEDTVKTSSEGAEAANSGDLNVPEDVSLNTPKSNPEGEDDDEGDQDSKSSKSVSDIKKEITEDTSAVAGGESADPTSTTGAEGSEADSSNVDTGVAKDEGGDLEGSVTEEAPPESPNFDSDNDVVDDEPVADHSVNSQQQQVFDTATGASEAMDTTNSAASNFSDETVQSRTENVVENGQNSLDSNQPPKADTIAEAADDILASTQATDMEEGDEQYKNLIAESQMDNLFN